MKEKNEKVEYINSTRYYRVDYVRSLQVKKYNLENEVEELKKILQKVLDCNEIHEVYDDIDMVLKNK